MRERGKEARGRRGKRWLRRAIAGRPELTRDGRDRATGLGFPIRNHREREEDEGNSPRAKTRPEKHPRGPRHGWPRRTTPASATGALEGLVLLGKRTRREREGRGSSPTRRESAKTAQSEGRRARQRLKLRRLISAQERAEQRQEEKRMGEGECSGVRGALHLKTEARGGEKRGSRAPASTWRLKQRIEGEAGDGLGEIELTGGPGLSAGEREREGEKGSRLAGGPWPRKREGTWGGF